MDQKEWKERRKEGDERGEEKRDRRKEKTKKRNENIFRMWLTSAQVAMQSSAGNHNLRLISFELNVSNIFRNTSFY